MGSRHDRQTDGHDSFDSIDNEKYFSIYKSYSEICPLT